MRVSPVNVHRNLIAIAAIVLLAVLLVGLALALNNLYFKGSSGEKSSRGVIVVTSIPSLASDVEELLCQGDKVLYIVPPGSDPHTYQLHPSDFDKIKEAKLVVVLGGEPLGEAIAGKAEELGVEVFKVAELEGIKLLKTPSGRVNYHFPIYDPENYLAFMNALAEKLSQLNPGCAEHYREALANVTEEVERFLDFEGSLGGLKAVASTVMVQYAVTWLGVDVARYVVEDPEAQATPAALEEVEGLIKSGLVDLAFITVDGSGRPVTKADAWLLEIAGGAGIPVIGVKAPFLPSSTVEKLESLVQQLSAKGLIGSEGP